MSESVSKGVSILEPNPLPPVDARSSNGSPEGLGNFVNTPSPNAKVQIVEQDDESFVQEEHFEEQLEDRGEPSDYYD